MKKENLIRDNEKLKIEKYKLNKENVDLKLIIEKISITGIAEMVRCNESLKKSYEYDAIIRRLHDNIIDLEKRLVVRSDDHRKAVIAYHELKNQ